MGRCPVARKGSKARVVFPSPRLFFRLEPGFIVADERLDLRRARQNAKPLLFVERDRESSHAHIGDGALLANLQCEIAFYRGS
jgi:hypothetical protein